MSRRTHCPQGHPYNKSNTYTDKKGYRHCRTCRRERRPKTGVGYGGRNAEKTHCPQGHEYTPENTYYYNGSRFCRECNRINLRTQNIKRYGITPDELAGLITAQDNRCAICRREFSNKVRRQIDHDHSCCPANRSCGRCVRGILCVECNHGLGRFHDDPDLLEAAAQYLRTYSADPALRC